MLYSGVLVLFSNQSLFSLILPSLPPFPSSNSPLITLSPYPGGSDGWYHHGDGSSPA